MKGAGTFWGMSSGTEQGPVACKIIAIVGINVWKSQEYIILSIQIQEWKSWYSSERPEPLIFTEYSKASMEGQ